MPSAVHLVPCARHRVANLVFVLLVAGCASSEPSLTRHELAEQVVVSAAACLPIGMFPGLFPSFRVSGSTIGSMEQELAWGGPDYLIGSPLTANDAQIACIARAGADCVAVRACFGVTTEITDDCPHSDRRCVGDTVVFCTEAVDAGEPPTIIRHDCGHEGLVCLEGGDIGAHQASCFIAACETQEVICDGRAMTTCLHERLSAGTCRVGSTCDAVAGACVGDGERCTAEVCDGDVMIPCEPINQRTTTPIDCGAIGMRCELIGSTSAGCVPPPGACNASELSQCDDGVMTYCGTDGEPHSYDCLEHGFAACAPGRCVPR